MTQRVILLGDTQVGKTCLCTRLIDNEFVDGQVSTVSPMFSPYSVTSTSGVDVSMEVWDTAGQERFASISKNFYRGANFAIVCYEATNQDPFPTIQKWIERVHEVTPQCKIFIAATKSDKIPQSDQLKCMNDSLELANRVGAVASYMTSSFTGSGITDLFMGIADEATSVNEPIVVKPTVVKPEKPDAPNGQQKKCC